jgi:hypothetical protein
MFRSAHVAAQDLDAAGLDRPRAGHQREQAGLAYPVRADEADHAAGRQLQCDPVQGHGFAVAQTDFLKPNHRR